MTWGIVVRAFTGLTGLTIMVWETLFAAQVNPTILSAGLGMAALPFALERQRRPPPRPSLSPTEKRLAQLEDDYVQGRLDLNTHGELALAALREELEPPRQARAPLPDVELRTDSGDRIIVRSTLQ